MKVSTSTQTTTVKVIELNHEKIIEFLRYYCLDEFAGFGSSEVYVNYNYGERIHIDKDTPLVVSMTKIETKTK